MKASIKYPGAKWSYAQWITSLLPPHRFYLEPFFGSGAVFFNKAPAAYETINDLDGQVVNFFRVCRENPDALAQAIALTPFSRQEMLSIQEKRAGEEIALTGDAIEDARRFAVRCCQGFGSKLSDRVGWKNTKHPNGPRNPRIWSGVPETILEMAGRLKNAQIEQTDAVKLIKACNDTNCLVYADPPYPASTRRSRMYRMEMMTDDEHERLLRALLDHRGPVVLSGYDNPLYNDMLQGWYKDQRMGHNNSGAARVETLWMNFEMQLTLEEKNHA